MRERRQVRVSAASSEEDDDSTVEVGSACAWKEFRHKFGPHGVQITVGILVEIAWCACIAGWLDRAEKACGGSKVLQAFDLVQHDEYNVKEFNWIVFLVCLAGRWIAITLWFRKQRRFGRCTVTASAASAMYILFSVSQWVIYFGAYYLVLDSLTTVTFNPQVQVKRIAAYSDTRATNATHLTDGAIDVLHADDAVLNLTMAHCLEEHPPLDCVSRVNLHVTCKIEFDPDVCSGYTWMGNGSNMMKCCVKDIYSLTRPDVPVPFALGQDLDTMFMLMQWLAVLSISWALKDLPIVPSSAQSSGFLNGCLLGLMDAVVFGAYLVNDRVLYPRYGINSDGTAAERKDKGYINLLRFTWIVAFVLATLSPVLYTFYSHSREEDAGAGTEDAPRDFAHSAESLIRSLQMLERQSALDHVEECLAIQREAYAQHSVEVDETLLVKVAPEGHEKLVEKLVTADKLLQDLSLAVGGPAPRPGKAKMLHGGTFSVQYTDVSDSSSDDEIVPVSRVYPDVSAEAEKRKCGPGCCKGWCGIGGLNEKFQRKAIVIDSVRSLCFLEVPFFLWRLYPRVGRPHLWLFRSHPHAQEFRVGHHGLPHDPLVRRSRGHVLGNDARQHAFRGT
ncbi:unnamed protein product [Prorocentrum cordatum]|uniref:Uncharacterized protein n=1 Tax=Prorocentrum cordatum TaxID=2364126 RepID=A0ABN9TS20_9DINO|nr:unnamed protein product [Polarella glacialis]